MKLKESDTSVILILSLFAILSVCLAADIEKIKNSIKLLQVQVDMLRSMK